MIAAEGKFQRILRTPLFSFNLFLSSSSFFSLSCGVLVVVSLFQKRKLDVPPVSPKTEPAKRSKPDYDTSAHVQSVGAKGRFQRVNANNVEYAHEALQDNSYEQAFGESGWGAKAHVCTQSHLVLIHGLIVTTLVIVS